ncbi:MAG TPA: hypothetical protein VGX70_01485 [Gemmataceae bacterium]|jgi:hypothetical protein|nr:hypothetical protein [Gemmataceae bacterium]
MTLKIVKSDLVVFLLAGLFTSPCRALSPGDGPSAVTNHPAAASGPSIETLAANLRDLLIQEFPEPLFEDQKNWGRTASVVSGVVLKVKGLNIHPEVKRQEKNHGTWRKIRVTGLDLPKTLTFDIRDVRKLDQGRTQFNVAVTFNARMDGSQQNWSSGIKLYDASLRARFCVKLSLVCETTSRIEPIEGWLVPDFVFRLRVTQAKADYDHFVTDHIAGLGGEAAKLLGDALQKILRPALEKKLLPKASAAIVKAADTKEIRVSWGSLMK